MTSWIRKVVLVAAALSVASCGEPTSTGVTALAISTATTGPSADSDGYVVRVDGGVMGRVAAVDSLMVLVSQDAPHEVRLSDVARNCALSGDSVRTVSATPDDTTRVSFEVTCQATSATMRVSISTTGADIDPNGYRILIDNVLEPSRASPNGVYAARVVSGHHSVVLSDLTSNCGPIDGMPESDLSREVNLGTGATADVVFAVACAAAAPAGDGHEIAFVTDRPPFDGNAPMRVYLMNQDGTGLRPDRGLQDGVIFGLRWLPDGVTLSFLSQPKDEDITFAAFSTLVIASGVLDTLFLVHEFDAPEWSRDGRQVAYSDSDVEEFGPAQVWVVDQAGDERQVSSDTVPHWNPTWSPDGTRLAYAGRGGSGDVDSTRILVRPLDGGPETVILKGFPGSIGGLAWSPDSSRVAFDGGLDPRLDPQEMRQIYTVAASGGDATALTSGEFNNSQPSWSPDGTRIAFTSRRDGNSEIYVMNADGSEQTRLTNDPGEDTHPAWRP